MTWSYEASVVTRGGKDYWRTWFIEECDQHGMFGLTEKHLPLVITDGPGFQSYREGTEIYLEDAPYFKKSKTHHRVCGPYSVIPSMLPLQAEETYKFNGKIIIFKEKVPSSGPWLDRPVRRIAEGVVMKYKQLSSEFNFFPYRFSIKKTAKYQVQHVRHESECWLCVR